MAEPLLLDEIADMVADTMRYTSQRAFTANPRWTDIVREDTVIRATYMGGKHPRRIAFTVREDRDV